MLDQEKITPQQKISLDKAEMEQLLDQIDVGFLEEANVHHLYPKDKIQELKQLQKQGVRGVRRCIVFIYKNLKYGFFSKTYGFLFDISWRGRYNKIKINKIPCQERTFWCNNAINSRLDKTR